MKKVDYTRYCYWMWMWKPSDWVTHAVLICGRWDIVIRLLLTCALSIVRSF